ncbi:hypothetical protein [Nocardia sp. NPDC050435]|uniref:hypothetical protein n=1 Tax=Nocardia sp. NPDC050435 TaxID=3155040 RepID=UPI0033EF10AF
MTDPNFDLYEANYRIEQAKPWSGWGWSSHADIKGYGTVDVVDTLADDRSQQRYSDGHPQGSTAPAGIIFRITRTDGTVSHYRKSGTYDSYGELTYDGPFERVAEVTRTVTGYEPVK